MSRIDWTDEEEFSGQFALWQANCRRSLRGKAGLAALSELEAALVALPERSLIHGSVEYEGKVCAIGAVIKARGLLDEVDECENTDDVAVELLGFPRMVAWKIVEMNDERTYKTNADRYNKMLAWVRAVQEGRSDDAT